MGRARSWSVVGPFVTAAGLRDGRHGRGIVIDRNRAACSRVRTVERVWMTMERSLVGIEDDTPIEYGFDRPDARRHIGIPQLQVASVLGSPILVQVHQEIDAP